MSKHTPGPWHIYSEYHSLGMDGYAPYTIYNVHDKENNHVCRVFNPQQMPDEANARLIAAAPDLYETLCSMIHVLTEIATATKLDLEKTVIKAKDQATGKEASVSVTTVFIDALSVISKVSGETNE